MELRRCSYNDCELLYIWTNDLTVRKNAFNSSPIKYEDHKIWFKSSMENNNRHMFILTENEIDLGQIRIDVEKDTAVISYSVDEKFRGKGIGKYMVNSLLDLIKKEFSYIKIVRGLVKKENFSSQKVFLNLGFDEIECNGYYEYNILIDRDE